MTEEAPLLTLDFETKSYADLPQVGAWKYSQDPTTEIICLAYGIGEEEIQTWWPGKELTGPQVWPKRDIDYEAYGRMPYDFYCAIASGCEVEAYNVSFEYSIYTNILIPQFGWAEIEDEQWRDLMAVAAYYAMPSKLEKLLRAMGLPGKNPEGGRLISKYSKLHLKTAKREIPPDDFQKFVEYCIDDVKGEQVASDLLGDLPPEELLVFQLDQEINKRGIPLDRKTIEDAIVIVDKRAEELAAEFRKMTGLNPTQNDKVKAWLESHGCVMENLQGKYIDKVLKESEEDDGEPDDGLSTEELDKALKKKAAVRLTPETRRALELRRKFNKASTKKLRAMLRQRDGSGRAYFQTKYHGAGTGRWTGTGFQPLNLSKGFEDVPPERLVADMSHRDPAWLDVMYGDAMDAVGKASRHHIKAEKGSRFIAGDFVSIEAVLLACNAREEWKIEAFRRKDPIYELMGCKIHKLGPEAEALARKDKKAFKHKFGPERFDGKTGELAFGYQGALGAWRKFDDSEKHTDERVIEICKGWREEHPAIVSWWRDLESAAVEAVAYPGRVTEVLGFRFEVIDAWLAMWLPNGKRIWYFDPQLRMEMPKWHDPEQYEDCAAGTCDCKPRRVLTYMAQKEGQWKRVQTYGGKLAENATQAASREILIPAMLRLRKYGYPVMLSVYDEIVCEMPYGKGSAKEMEEIMTDRPGDWGDLLPAGSRYNMKWALDFPVRADCWEGERYKK